MEWSFNKNLIVVITLFKCDMSKGYIFKTFRSVEISRIFIYRYTVWQLEMSDRHRLGRSRKF